MTFRRPSARSQARSAAYRPRPRATADSEPRILLTLSSRAKTSWLELAESRAELRLLLVWITSRAEPACYVNELERAEPARHPHDSCSLFSYVLETTARPCRRANIGGSQCSTGGALWSIFALGPSSIAVCILNMLIVKHYSITSNNFVVLAMINSCWEEKRLRGVYERKASEGSSMNWT